MKKEVIEGWGDIKITLDMKKNSDIRVGGRSLGKKKRSVFTCMTAE